MQEDMLSAAEALEQLKLGNKRYLRARRSVGNISPRIRRRTCKEGQSPYAIIVGCSDSRAIPESIFMAGIGELFVIRVAGNVIDKHQLGSIEYAASHLGTRLIVVLGHDNCGAVGAALKDEPEGYVRFITDEIRRIVGDEKNYFKACCLNVKGAVSMIRQCLKIKETKGKDKDKDSLMVCGAIYHIDSGRVDFFE